MREVAAPPAIQTALVARSGSAASAIGVQAPIDRANATSTAHARTNVSTTNTAVARGALLIAANGALTGLVRLDEAMGFHIAR